MQTVELAIVASVGEGASGNILIDGTNLTIKDVDTILGWARN